MRLRSAMAASVQYIRDQGYFQSPGQSDAKCFTLVVSPLMQFAPVQWYGYDAAQVWKDSFFA